MTADGVLYIQEQIAELLADEINAALENAGWSYRFRLSGEGVGDNAPTTVGGNWGNVEARWPSESDIPIIIKRDHRVGTLHIELESTVKRDITGAEYLGKELSDYEITVQEKEQ